MHHLRFDNRYLSELPGDAEVGPRTRQVFGACWSRVFPTPVATPRAIAVVPEVARLVGLSDEDTRSPLFAEVFGGNRVLFGMDPYAACYGGHQFGHWAGQLGDGRAITLGEVLTPAGERWELQLKGAGRTPYSRAGDGRAVLRSSIRELLCSEAMHHLGVPTTRALSLVTTGERVVRDMLYDGNARPEPGAVVCRVAPSFVRFGSFEILAAREEPAALERLVDFTIARDFAHLTPLPADERRGRWFEEVCERTARMVAHWMRVGFVHGVMNTDNMSILGLTLDYGPYGWIDDFDLDWTPNTTDATGRRYRFGQQAQVAGWNLGRLGSALHGVVASDALRAGIARYGAVYRAADAELTSAKFGLDPGREDDVELMRDAWALLQAGEVDMTLFFRGLARVEPVEPALSAIRGALYDAQQAPAFEPWLARYARRLGQDPTPASDRRARMNAVNPLYVLRNYLAQEAIDAAEQGDPSLVHELLDVMRRPYDEQPGRDRFAQKRPDWARNRPGCSMLSCSS